MRKIDKDEELLVNYGMNLADSPEWYRVVWIRHQREFKNASDATIRRLLDRYAENTCRRIPIPECEELNIPDPQGFQNIEDMPEEDEIEATTQKQQYLDMLQKSDTANENGARVNLDDIEDDMLPRVEEIEWFLKWHFVIF